MEPISTVAAFASLCNSVIQAGKAFRSSDISSDEERLLEHACHHGLMELVSADDLLTMHVDGHLFANARDPAERIRYLSAFKALCERGFLFPEGDCRFTCSAQALDHGRRLADERQTFNRQRFDKPYVPYLTDDEKTTLAAAGTSEELRILIIHALEGLIMSCGEHQLFASEDPRIRSVCDSLSARGFVTKVPGESRGLDIYRVTPRGQKAIAAIAAGTTA